MGERLSNCRNASHGKVWGIEQGLLKMRQQHGYLVLCPKEQEVSV
jgi:hypothetical protein